MVQDGPTEDFEDLYENAPCGYLSIRPNGRIFKANRTFASWIGLTPEELKGRHLHELLDVAGQIFFETHFAPLLRMQGFFDEVALDLVTQQGSRLPVLVNARERRNAGGEHVFTRLTIFNATDRRRYERELLNARDEAKAAEKQLVSLRCADRAVLLDERASAALREEFIAVLGHDLRNPLAAVMGGLQLLLNTKQDERAQAIISMMQNSAGRMAGLIDDLLDFARGRLGGGLAITRVPNAMLEPVLTQVVAELQLAWPARVFETALAIGGPVDCDPGRISQLASNLLGNAVVHGAPDTPIRLEARTEGARFWLSVSNGGQPIPMETLDPLFEPFFRADHRASLQGLGLGLYIVSEIARAHGGGVRVNSNTQETCFTFEMPLRVS